MTAGRSRRVTLLLLLAALVAPAGAGSAALEDMPRVRIDVDGREYVVRLAATAAHRAAGFQHVAPGDMADTAIYFAYARPSRPSYHMFNVARPLQLAWVDPDGHVLGVIRMQPGSAGHRPDAPVSGVLEYTAAHPLAERVRAGSTVEVLAAP